MVNVCRSFTMTILVPKSNKTALCYPFSLVFDFHMYGQKQYSCSASFNHSYPVMELRNGNTLYTTKWVDVNEMSTEMNFLFEQRAALAIIYDSLGDVGSLSVEYRCTFYPFQCLASFYVDDDFILNSLGNVQSSNPSETHVKYIDVIMPYKDGYGVDKLQTDASSMLSRWTVICTNVNTNDDPYTNHYEFYFDRNTSQVVCRMITTSPLIFTVYLESDSSVPVFATHLPSHRSYVLVATNKTHPVHVANVTCVLKSISGWSLRLSELDGVSYTTRTSTAIKPLQTTRRTFVRTQRTASTITNNEQTRTPALNANDTESWSVPVMMFLLIGGILTVLAVVGLRYSGRCEDVNVFSLVTRNRRGTPVEGSDETYDDEW